jgi:16S rRNA (uracil1498-N3)-methyltransferase
VSAGPRHTFRYRVGEVPGEGAIIALAPEDAHHLARVVRRRAGEVVEVVDPAGRVWPAVVRRTGPEAQVEVAGPARDAWPVAPVDVYLGMCEWGRVDWAVEKLTELGVRSLTLFASERARRPPDAEAWPRRRERLERVAAAALRQSGRGALPRLGMLVRFAAVLGELRPGEAFVLDPRAGTPLGAALAAAPPSVAPQVVVGPDAGLADGEVAAACEAGAVAGALGPGMLRAETAALAGAVLALGRTGHLGAP